MFVSLALVHSFSALCLSLRPAHQSSLTSKPKKAPSSDSGPSPLLLPRPSPGASPRDQYMEEAPLGLDTLTQTHTGAPLLSLGYFSLVPSAAVSHPLYSFHFFSFPCFLGLSILVTVVVQHPSLSSIPSPSPTSQPLLLPPASFSPCLSPFSLPQPAPPSQTWPWLHLYTSL